MKTLEQIAKNCPAPAWIRHRFSVELTLGVNKKIRHSFDIPIPQVRQPKPHTVSEVDISERYGEDISEYVKSAYGESTLDYGVDGIEQEQSILSVITNALNAMTTATVGKVKVQVELCKDILNALTERKWIQVMIQLKGLQLSLNEHAGETWLYGWNEWIDAIASYVETKVSKAEHDAILKILDAPNSP